MAQLDQPSGIKDPIPNEEQSQVTPPAAAPQPQPTQAQPQNDMDRQPAGFDAGRASQFAKQYQKTSFTSSPSQNTQQPQQSAQPESFDGKEVEGKFFGMKARVTAEGVPQIYIPRTKSWQAVNEHDGGIWKQVAKGIYSANESIPETAASVAANLIPGEGMVAGGVRALTAGGTAAAGRMSGISEYLAQNLFENPKDFFILKKIAGVDGEPGAVSSGLTTGLAQGAMEVAGGFAKSSAAKSADQAQTNQTVLNILQQGKALEKAAQDSGIPVRGTQISSQLPGGGDASAMESRMAGGQYGPVNQAQIQIANQQQAQSVGDAVDRVIKKVAPNVDFDNMDIKAITGKAGQRLNFADRVEQNMQQNLSANRSAVDKIARDRQFDARPIVDSFESQIKTLLPFHKGLVKSDGSVDMQAFMDIAKQEGYSDQSLGKFAQSYYSLKNSIAREASALSQEIGAPQPGQNSTMGPAFNPGTPQIPSSSALIPQGKAGDAVAGITFKQLSAFTDRVQDMAFANGKDTQFTRAIGKVASAAKGMEDDVTSQLFKENGQEAMAQRVINQKESYAATIGDLRTVSQNVSMNPDNAARIVFNSPLSTIKRVLPALSDQNRREIAGSLLLNSAYEDISKIPATNMISSVNADSIRNQFFGTAEARAKSDLIFGDASPDIENILHVARMVQGAGTGSSEQAAMSGAGKILKIIPRMMTKGVPLDKLGVLLNSVFSDNPTAKDIINTSLSDMIVKQENNLSSSVRSAKTASAYSSLFNNPVSKTGGSAASNFIKNEIPSDSNNVPKPSFKGEVQVQYRQ